MKIVFLYPMSESLGIEYLSAFLKKHGHQTMLVFDPHLFAFTLKVKSLSRVFNFRKILINEVVSAKPDLICFSVVSDYFIWATQLAEDIKKVIDVPIVFGGPHATTVPENVIRHKYIDFVITGEGEEPLLELVNNLESGKDTTNIKNLCYKVDGRVINNPVRPLIPDLDSLPFPDKGLYYDGRCKFINNHAGLRNTYTIMGSRGCLNGCSYCQNNYLQKLYKGSKYLRFRSIANIIHELAIAKEKYNIKTVTFLDDAFDYNKKWLRELLGRYKKEISLPFVCFLHPSYIDKETVDLLEETGCMKTCLGVQSTSEKMRKDVLLRYESNDDIIRAIRLISHSKIILSIDLIIGLPGETLDDLLETAKFFNRHKVNLMNFLWLRYFPKAEITKYVESEEIINEINEGSIYSPYTGGKINFNKEKAKLIYFIILANFVPGFILKFLLKIKAYRFLPAKSSFYACVFFASELTNIFSREKYLLPQLPIIFESLRYHKYYISKYFLKRAEAAKL